MEALKGRNFRIATAADRVYKEECIFCYDTPESSEGLYVCMNSFFGYCQRHLLQFRERFPRGVFLHIKTTKHKIVDQTPVAAPTKLAIGIEGGFDACREVFEYEHTFGIFLPDVCTEIPLPCPDLPEALTASCASIQFSTAASVTDNMEALSGTWDGTKREITKHENLVQLDNGVKIPPKDWQCQECGLKENLWLNLTDGSIHCGRKYFNGEGGNNHAVEYYEKTKYPLVVKLGTITSEESDVYSYDEDAMVLDPNLPHHLAHFGINIKELQKTDKSMLELEIDINQRIGEWAIIQEAGTKLVPLYGPGCTGLANLGNSCYLNSIMQVLFNVPDFQMYYLSHQEEMFKASFLSPNFPPKDFNAQMSKLAYGLWSGDYSREPRPVNDQAKLEEQPGIKPQMFKTLIGQGHPEFSTNRQQDAQEFFLHLLSVLERHCRGTTNPANALKFQVEERLECAHSKKVKYTTRTDYLLSLPIPLEAAVNKDEVQAYEAKKAEIIAGGGRPNPEEIVRSRIPLLACLDYFAQSESVDDFYSTALNEKSVAIKMTRLQTFPDYLMLHMKKFCIGEDWVPKKLDVSIDVPDELNLSALRAKGLQPGELELPEIKPVNEFEYNEQILYQLCDMGFSIEGCKRALFYTQNENIEVAMNWVMEHMNDFDFSSPFTIPGVKQSNPNFTPDPEALATISSMGFSPSHAAKALEATNNNLERAVDWIFSHTEEMETEETISEEESSPPFRDGSEKYKLFAFISHMGTSTVVGHYVCHILKDGRWVIFNDNKVALSENPPKDLAYMYLYRRSSLPYFQKPSSSP